MQERSSSLNPRGEGGGQRPPPCLPQQPHETELGAPHAALPLGERGWACPLRQEQGLSMQKGPQNCTPCAAQEGFWSRTGAELIQESENIAVSSDTVTFSNRGSRILFCKLTH